MFRRTDSRQDLDAVEQCLQIQFRDPEACAFAWALSCPKRALETISEEGYVCHHMLLHHPWLESLRFHAGFPEVVSRAAERSLQAHAVFIQNGGDQLLEVQQNSNP